MILSCSNNNTPRTLNLQDKSYKIPVSTNVPIELTPASPVMQKTFKSFIKSFGGTKT